MLEGKVSLLGVKGPTRKLRSHITHNNKDLIIVVLIRLQVVGLLLIIILKDLQTDITDNNNYNSILSSQGQRRLRKEANLYSFGSSNLERAGNQAKDKSCSMRTILIANSLPQLLVTNTRNPPLSRGSQPTTLSP